MSSKINFGLIGVGSFGIKRAKSIIESSNAELYAIYDNDKAKSKKIAEELIQSLDEMKFLQMKI